MIELGTPISEITAYEVKCPSCYRVFNPKGGTSNCPYCKSSTPHPADLVWIVSSRKQYYNLFWNRIYDD